jgi:protein-S-isoprenylcysteine O-methyltransferase Ste14
MSEVLRAACLTGLVASVGSFAWAMQGGFFRTCGRVGVGFRTIQVCGALALGANLSGLLIFQRVGTIGGLAALVLYCLSLGLFWSSISAHRGRPPTHAFSMDVPDNLTETAAYRFIRHPFYSSYLLTWIAAPVATGEPALLVPFGVMLAIYWCAAVGEEMKFLRSDLRDEYLRYRARTGMFLPWM